MANIAVMRKLPHTMGGESASVDYQPPRTSSHRHALLILVALTIAGVGVYVIFDRLWPPVHEKWMRRQAIASLLKLQQACMQYRLPPDLVVLDHSPSTPEILKRAGFAKVPDEIGGSFDSAAVLVPSMLRELSRQTMTIQMKTQFGSSFQHNWGGLVFLHERRTPSGTPVLLAVCAYSDGQPDQRYQPSYNLRVWRFHPATETSGPENVGGHYNIMISLGRPKEGALQVLAGQSNSVDGSKFIIPVRVGGKAIDLHCLVRDDYSLKVRASEGYVQQDEKAVSAVLYPEFPSSVGPNYPNMHKGLD